MATNPNLAVPRTYSTFWPVVAVFATLIILQAIYVAGDLSDRSQIRTAQAELTPVVDQARKITQIVEELGKDLITLANSKNAEAARIVTELDIRLNDQTAAR